MGWSATAKACDIERAWSDACHKQTGQSNAYETEGKRFFYDTGREQRDGAITGQVFRMLPDGMAVRSGSFRIESDGTVTRYPTGLRKALGL
jgi:hypothetical protein